MKSITSFLLFAFIAISLISCNKDDDGDGIKTTNPPSNVTEHTYSFTVTGGTLDGETFAGSVENDQLLAISLSNDNTQNITVTKGEEEIQSAIFSLSINYLNNVIQPLTSDSESSHSIVSLGLPYGDEYLNFMSVAGEISVNNLVLESGIGGVSFASFNATFNGTFENWSTEETVSISGTLSVKQPVD